jgi:acyl-CoA thioester hydrolase
MYESTTQVNVRYGETDQMGQVYYGNYSLYYETGRADAIKQLGYSYKQMEADGIMMPVAELHIRYILPARYDDMLTIKTIINELPSRKMTFQQQQLINSGYTILLFINKQYNRVSSPPQKLLELIKPFFE